MVNNTTPDNLFTAMLEQDSLKHMAVRPWACQAIVGSCLLSSSCRVQGQVLPPVQPAAHMHHRHDSSKASVVPLQVAAAVSVTNSPKALQAAYMAHQQQWLAGLAMVVACQVLCS
jgi:hypothetical protein